MLGDVIVRADDQAYLNVLRNFRFKRVTEADISTLSSRSIKLVSPEERVGFLDAAVIFPTNEECDSYARRKIRKLQVPVLRLAPVNAASTVNDLLVYEGAKVQIITNISVRAGLTNECLARIIRSVFFKQKTYPDFIILQVEGWTGPTIFGGLPVKVQYIYQNHQKQFPIKQAIGQTLHKNQGKTLNKLIFNFTAIERFPNYSYTGLSRVRNLQDLLIGNNFLPLTRFRGCQDFQRGFDIQIQELRRLGFNIDPNTSTLTDDDTSN
ncbi:ATP-dependent DNA helicase pif1 [Folsomia candida]|uniref:ATP-dependent DNA helicase pif1 n=1 Tax=Folsomia candida TaxID=158441 RepID=A0A226DAD3_FOLCA|nr:ATP-dependent DNA helicase pif1 [Folsomia candida]